MIRGIERRNIFRDKTDRLDFLARLEKLIPEAGIVCYGWAFLSNHAHFLFKTGHLPLSQFMRRLLTGYVVSFNRRHKRHGQLFQNDEVLGSDLPMSLKFKVNHSKSGIKIPLRATILTMK